MPSLPFPILAIADEETLGPDFAARAAAAVRAGLGWVCLRARRSGTGARVRLGRELMRECPGVFLTVHGDPEARAALGAPGLHLPSRGFDPAVLRWAHPGVLLGVSCHTRAEVAAAAVAGADYALLSPFLAPVSKAPGGPVLGVEGFREAIRGIPLPVLALGGVVPEELKAAAGAGAAGAAVLGSLFLAPDVEARAEQYRREAAGLWPVSGPQANQH